MHASWRWFIGGVLLATLAVPATAQSPAAPELTRQQRSALQALLQAADGTAADVNLAETDWPVHVLRASDGSHYVAFSINRVDGLRIDRAAVVYVRLATRRTAQEPFVAERSAVAEWLGGQTPAPALPRRGIAFGDMPTYGAGGIAARGPAIIAQTLQILELERERAREKREQEERRRKAALEGGETPRAVHPMLPFEDFDVQARAVADASGAAVLRRSLTAGPGEYQLTVAWIDPADGTKAVARVARRALSLPPASTTALAMSNVIVADAVSVRETPMPSAAQTSHPYSIGAADITPARDHVLTPDERLALVVQIINARGAPSGKPDVQVSFRIFRHAAGRDENIGSLAPQLYNELTLPFDFDLSKGHPIFAAVAVPLTTFKRGDYRMEIAANDRVAGAGVMAEVTFTVAATPGALLREAPPLAPVFDPAQASMTTAVPVVLGAVRASGGNDREAIAAWQTALDNGVDAQTVRPLMIDAWLRLNDSSRAMEFATQGLETAPGDARLTRQLARALLLAERHDDAVRLLEAYLQNAPGDLEAQWLALHALYAGFVSGSGPGATPQGRMRITELGERYATAGGAHAALARDWVASAR